MRDLKSLIKNLTRAELQFILDETEDKSKIMIYSTSAGGEYPIHGARQCKQNGNWQVMAWSLIGEPETGYKGFRLKIPDNRQGATP